MLFRKDLWMKSLWSYYSDDNGRSWKAGAKVPNPNKVLTQEPRFG